MAADYVEEIRKVQAEAPYYLLGWSFGGIVAQEMAVQLQDAGQRVDGLILVDAYPAPETGDNGGEDLPDTRRRITEDLEEGRLAMAKFFTRDEHAAYRDVILNNIRIQHAHKIRKFKGDLLVVSGSLSDAADGRWHPYVSGSVREIKIDCPHTEMMTRPDAVRQIGEELTRFLGR